MTIMDVVNSIIRLITHGAPMSAAEVNTALRKRAKEKGQALNWDVSIVDLLKLLDLDSSLAARRDLAIELGYDGHAADGSAEKNIWLHKRVLEEVAKHGINIPRND